MEARTEWVPGTDQVRVWVYQRGLDGEGVYYTLSENGWEGHRVAQGEQIEHAFEAPTMLMKALAEAATDLLPADRAQAQHLADAIAVRDRILAAYLPAQPPSGEQVR